MHANPKVTAAVAMLRRVEAVLLEGTYPTGQTVSDAETQALALDQHVVCPTWNYTIRPWLAMPCGTPPVPANQELVA